MNYSVHLIFLLAVLTTSTQGQSVTVTTTPTSSDNLLSDLLFIYIIAGVILFLILIIVILCGVVGLLCQRRVAKTKSRKRKQSKAIKPLLQHAETTIEMEKPIPLPKSPMRSKSESSISAGTKSSIASGSMSDFPLLCRVLQDYSSDHHRTRLNSINSNEQLETSIQGCNDSVFNSPSHGTSSVLEASTSTTNQPLHDSHDYDELDNVMKDLQSKTNQVIPPPFGVIARNIPTVSSSSEADEIMERSESPDKLFDDPKYSHLSVSSEYDPSLVQSPPHESPVNATTVSEHPTHSVLESAGDKVFDEKEFKEYMSLEQVLEIVHSKTTESQEDEEIPTEADIEMLYSPRVLGPAQVK